MKNPFPFISVLLLITTISYAQITAVAEKFNMPSGQNETSGILFYNGKLISHNDSGGENKIFEIDTLSGLVTRVITINNATNNDWEDITQDDDYIYIGDIGNNDGSRTDLRIYKIAKLAYNNSDTVSAQLIEFSYANQTDFTPAANNTVWDAEALVSYNSTELLMFSKNWVTGITEAYVISKTPAAYVLSPLSTSLNSGGLISGATFNPFTNRLMLVGYTNILLPFVWESKTFSVSDVFSLVNNQYFFTTLGMEQIEAITYIDSNYYFVSSELFDISPFSETAKLISFKTVSTVAALVNVALSVAVKVYPNPVTDVLHIEVSQPVQVLLINSVGQILLDTTFPFSKDLDMMAFSRGIYTVKLICSKKVITKRIVKV